MAGNLFDAGHTPSLTRIAAASEISLAIKAWRYKLMSGRPSTQRRLQIAKRFEIVTIQVRIGGNRSTITTSVLEDYERQHRVAIAATKLSSIEHHNWVERLETHSSVRDEAIAELRVYLIRGLSGSLTHRYGGDVLVEDVVQVALLKILASLDTFQSRSRFTTWALAIATRIGISELRRRCYRDISLNQVSEGEHFQIDIVDSASSLEDQDSRQRVLHLLQQLINESLSDKQRIAIRGVLAGLPIEEIASRLQSNRNATYKLVHDAKLRIRRGFEASGMTADDILADIA